MRLVNLTINNFRGFGPTVPTICLDGDLLLFYGPNGFGKTSIAEAIEWLFYGTTKRRQRGDTYSRAEYAGSFGNIHGSQLVQVEAEVLINGQTLRLARRLTTGEASETLIDGQVLPFSSINVSPIEAVYPVVAQHGLQTFIHAKPKERRDAISAALGLDELISLKSALDTARTSFQRTPPNIVVQARRELLARAEILSTIPATAALGARWRAVPLLVEYDNDLAALLTASQHLTGIPANTVDDALALLRTYRTSVSRSIFDGDALMPPQDSTSLVAVATTALVALNSALANVERAITAAVAQMASTYSAVLLGLWEKGLELASTDEQCPLCEEPTFSDRRKEELRRRLAATEQTLSLTRQLAAAKDIAVGLLRQAKTATSRLAVRVLTTEDRNQLTRLYADNPTQLQAFLSTYDTLSSAFAKYTSETDSCGTFLEQVASRIENAADAPAIVAEVADLQIRTTAALSAVADALGQYQADWDQFQPTLAARIASNELVSKIDTLGQTLRDVEHMRVVAQHERILNETQTLIRTIEASIQQTQAQLLTTRGAEVKALYDRLNRGANVAFDVMEPGTDTMKLHATSFGVRMPAAANLSECQLNCVGLAMWLMRATTPSSPFGFIMLDDPVQSMDDDHAEAFIADIVPHLMDEHGKQVLILSHVKRVTDRLRDLHQGRLTRVYHLDTFDRIGPTITEQIRLRMLLAEIKGAARGNESNREYAVDRIRVLVEHFIREMHLQITGQPAPPRFDRANASQLLPLFQTLAGTTQQEHAGLRDTIGFCDPAHHTEVGYSVPLTSNIQPHIDRMEGLLNKYRL